MIYDYFPPKTPFAELKLRKKRAEVTRVTKRNLEIHKAARVKRYEEVMSIENFLNGLLSDCVGAACEMVPGGTKFSNF